MFAVARPVEIADHTTAREFPGTLLEAVPYRIHTILTDRAIGTPLVREPTATGIQFAAQPRNRGKVWTSEPDRFLLNPIDEIPGLNSQADL